MYIAISFFRSSLSHIYYSQLYSEFRYPLILFSLWTCPSESIPSPYPMSSLVVSPQGWAPLALACTGMLCEPKSHRGTRNKTHINIQTYNIKQEAGVKRAARSWWETWAPTWARVFILLGQYKEKAKVKIKL
jgi:hypothetical protein